RRVWAGRPGWETSFPTRRSSELVGMVAEQAAGDGAIGPVPGAGAREAAVQFDLGALWRASDQCARDQAEAAGTRGVRGGRPHHRSEEHTSELQSREHLVSRLLRD